MKRLSVFAVLALISCGGGDGSGGPGQTTEVSPETIEDFLTWRGQYWIDGIATGHLALLEAVLSGEAEGVELDGTWPNLGASVGLDLDDDGVRETSLDYDLSFVALLRSWLNDWQSIEYTARFEEGPYLTGEGEGTVSKMGSHAYYVDSTFDLRWESSGSSVQVTETWISAEDTGGGIYMSGGMCMSIGATEFEVWYEPDGYGWWTTRIIGDGWEIP